MNIFCSVLTYELGKALGVVEATAEFRRQIDDPKAPDSLPAARMVARLRELGNVMLYHGAGTCLAKARSRAAHAAHKWLAEQDDSQRAIWVMCDDDVECDQRTLRALLAVAGHDRIAVLPCAVRGNDREQHTVNVVWESTLLLPLSPESVVARPVLRGGCGVMVVPLGALRLMHERLKLAVDEEGAFQLDWWHDDDDDVKPALFAQRFAPRSETDSRRTWLGEDYSFCELARSAGVPIFAPVEGVSIHDGIGLDLKLCQR